MADFRNCKRCGKLFVYNGIPLCNACVQEDEETYKLVKEYIEKHPRCTTIEVSEALDVPVEKILQFLREGKLELSSDNPNIVLGCERCGRPINTGRYCKECASFMESQFKRGFVSEEKRVHRESDRMYTAHRRKRY